MEVFVGRCATTDPIVASALSETKMLRGIVAGDYNARSQGKQCKDLAAGWKETKED